MRRSRLVLAALVAVCGGASVLLSVSASALPVVLPESASERSWTGKNIGTPEVETTAGESLACTAATAEGTEQSKKPLGIYHLHITGCSTLGGLATCSSLGDAAGSILITGSWHLVFDTLGATLGQAGVAILDLVGDVHVECAGILILALAGGMTLCLVTKPTTSSLTHEGICQRGGVGKQLETTYYNEGGTLVRVATCLTSEAGATPLETLLLASGTASESSPTEVML
jgi:hypothetical protein